MTIIQNAQEFLIVFMAISITISVIALIFLNALGIAVLSEFTSGMLIGTITNVALVAIIRYIFGKPLTPNGITPNNNSDVSQSS